MTKLCKYATIMIWLMIFCGRRAQSQGDQYYSVKGVTTYQSGSAAIDFAVLLQPLYRGQSLPMTVRTNQKGEYLFERVRPGDYVIYPYSNMGGFPLRGDMFLSKEPDRLKVEGALPTISKNLILPSAVGVLEVRVTDSSGQPVVNMPVVFCHSHEPTRSAKLITAKDGTVRKEVPSGEQLAVAVYGRERGTIQKNQIVLKPEESIHMDFTISGKGTRNSVEGELCIPFGGD